MKKLLLSTVVALGLSVSVASAAPVEYTLDTSHTSIEFYVKHLGFSNFQGEFQGFDGKIVFDADAPQNSTLNVNIDPASIDTDVPKLDAHLKNSDFFDVEKFPKMSFKSKSIKITGKNTGEITGDLTMHGVTKEVVLNTTLNKAADHPMMKIPAIGLSATGMLKRSDFGISKYVPGVGDEVTIRIETEAHAK